MDLDSEDRDFVEDPDLVENPERAEIVRNLRVIFVI